MSYPPDDDLVLVLAIRVMGVVIFAWMLWLWLK
jgi:hypothetical protein